MEDLANMPFEANQESNSEVDHYHAHGKGCEDMGHNLIKHSSDEVKDDEAEDKNDHGLPEQTIENEEKGEHTGAYPGMIRKIR